MYAALGSIANLTVKFHINPFNNYNISWSIGDSEFPDGNISHKEKEQYIQTTYSISKVTKQHLGNYTVQVINHAIMGEPNEAIFTVVLKWRGKNTKPCKFRPLHHVLAYFNCLGINKLNCLLTKINSPLSLGTHQ